VRVASLALLVILVNPTLAFYQITEDKMQNGGDDPRRLAR